MGSQDVSATTGAPRAELDVASDLARRGLLVSPLLVVLAALWQGTAGAVGAALAIAVVLFNFALSATGIAWAADRGAATMGTVVLGGYVLRIAIVLGALFLARAQSWIDLVTFGITLVLTHVALLVWEARFVNMTLAAPGLAPEPLSMHGED